MNKYRTTIEEMLDDDREKQIIDLRKTMEYRMGHCDGAISIPEAELEERMDEIATERPVYLMCTAGITSDEVAETLREKGIEAYSMAGGYRAYIVWKMENMEA